MNGFDIKLLSQKTGIGENKIWQILKHRKELCELPYSLKSGKNRIFFPPFIEWLKEYEGISVISVKSDRNDRNDKKPPSGAQLREYRLAAEHDLITIVQFQHLSAFPLLPLSTRLRLRFSCSPSKYQRRKKV